MPSSNRLAVFALWPRLLCKQQESLGTYQVSPCCLHVCLEETDSCSMQASSNIGDCASGGVPVARWGQQVWGKDMCHRLSTDLASAPRSSMMRTCLKWTFANQSGDLPPSPGRLHLAKTPPATDAHRPIAFSAPNTKMRAAIFQKHRARSHLQVGGTPAPNGSIYYPRVAFQNIQIVRLVRLTMDLPGGCLWHVQKTQVICPPFCLYTHLAHSVALWPRVVCYFLHCLCFEPCFSCLPPAGVGLDASAGGTAPREHHQGDLGRRRGRRLQQPAQQGSGFFGCEAGALTASPLAYGRRLRRSTASPLA